MQNLTGKLLISPPNIADRRFSSSVIYVVNHNESGSWGLTINKPIVYSNTELMTRLGIQLSLPGRAHLGGPVDSGVIHIIHDGREVNRQTIDAGNGVYINSDLGFLSSLIDRPHSEDFRVIVGCCTWAPGQLEHELAGLEPWTPEHSWLTADADISYILSLDGDSQWQEGIERAARATTSQWMC